MSNALLVSMFDVSFSHVSLMVVSLMSFASCYFGTVRLGIIVVNKRRSRNIVRIGSISVDPITSNGRFRLSDGCKETNNEEEGKKSFGDAVHDKLQRNENNRRVTEVGL